ncbi:hypothetical protein QTN25_006874 [Entamoeba marina]
MQRQAFFTVRVKNIGKAHNILLVKHFHSADEFEQEMFGVSDSDNFQLFDDDDDEVCEILCHTCKQENTVQVGNECIVEDIEIERCSIRPSLTLF